MHVLFLLCLRWMHFTHKTNTFSLRASKSHMQCKHILLVACTYFALTAYASLFLRTRSRVKCLIPCSWWVLYMFTNTLHSFLTLLPLLAKNQPSKFQLAEYYEALAIKLSNTHCSMHTYLCKLHFSSQKCSWSWRPRYDVYTCLRV